MYDGRRFEADRRLPPKQGQLAPLLAKRMKREMHTERWGAAQAAGEKHESGSSLEVSGTRQETSEIGRQ